MELWVCVCVCLEFEKWSLSLSQLTINDVACFSVKYKQYSQLFMLEVETGVQPQ